MSLFKILGAGFALWCGVTLYYTRKHKIPLALSQTLLHCYVGISFGELMRQLKENGFQVSFVYWHRLVFLLVKSVFTSLVGFLERRKFGKQIEETKVAGAPVFVIGHWRSGTTLMHNLLAEDERFAYPTTFQCLNPHVFVGYEKVQMAVTKYFVPKTRPMDNMAFSPLTPQEDEFATATLCGVSPQTGDVFAGRYKHYYKFLTFRQASRDMVNKWKDAFLYFCKKLTIKNNGKRLLLKSPHHTARVKIILEMFPDAKFVHIYRDPYVVFQSTKHLMNTLYPLSYLQIPPTPEEQAFMAIDRYKEMYDQFFEDKKLLKPDQLFEISYEQLAQHPLEELENVYKGLDLGSWDAVKPKIESYVSTLRGYKKNKHPEIPADQKAEIVRKWKPFFEAWGYEM